MLGDVVVLVGTPRLMNGTPKFGARLKGGFGMSDDPAEFTPLINPLIPFTTDCAFPGVTGAADEVLTRVPSSESSESDDEGNGASSSVGRGKATSN